MRALRLVALALVLIAPAAHADRLDVGDYGPADKLGRGLANMVTGVLALPGSIAEGAHDNGVAVRSAARFARGESWVAPADGRRRRSLHDAPAPRADASLAPNAADRP